MVIEQSLEATPSPSLLLLFNLWGSKSKLELKSNSSKLLLVNCKYICVRIFLFVLKVRLKDLKFEFCRFIGVELQINLQLTDKVSLKFDFSSSLLGIRPLEWIAY